MPFIFFWISFTSFIIISRSGLTTCIQSLSTQRMPNVAMDSNQRPISSVPKPQSGEYPPLISVFFLPQLRPSAAGPRLRLSGEIPDALFILPEVRLLSLG